MQEGVVADMSEGDRDAVAWEMCWCMSGDFFYRHRVMPREQLYASKDSSFSLPSKMTSCGKQKTILNTLEESSLDDSWNIDENRFLF